LTDCAFWGADQCQSAVMRAKSSASMRRFVAVGLYLLLRGVPTKGSWHGAPPIVARLRSMAAPPF
jgi:hypothetical protein